MKRILLAALLALALCGCAARTMDGDAGRSASSAAEPAPESAPAASEPEASEPEGPDYTDLEVCQETFLAPYGNLIYAEGWESYEDLGPDTLFQFTIQRNYHIYMSKIDYAERYGPEWARIDPPLDGEGFATYPAEEVEATALAYFGAPAEYLRTAYSYDAEQNDYQLRGGGLGEEWWPKVTAVEREGDLLRLSYDVWVEGYGAVVFQDGKEVSTEVPARKVHSARMTVKLGEDGGFQYQSVEVFPEEGNAAG